MLLKFHDVVPLWIALIIIAIGGFFYTLESFDMAMGITLIGLSVYAAGIVRFFVITPTPVFHRGYPIFLVFIAGSAFAIGEGSLRLFFFLKSHLLPFAIDIGRSAGTMIGIPL